MLDIQSYIERVEKGAEFEVDLGEGNTFKVQVRKASMRDPQYFKAQSFLISLASINDGSDELQESMVDGESVLDPEQVAKITKDAVDRFSVEGFAGNLEILSTYVVDTLVVGWSGIEKSGTSEPLPFDRELFAKLIESEAQIAIQIFGFAMSPSNYGEEVVEEAEKNS